MNAPRVEKRRGKYRLPRTNVASPNDQVPPPGRTSIPFGSIVQNERTYDRNPFGYTSRKLGSLSTLHPGFPCSIAITGTGELDDTATISGGIRCSRRFVRDRRR